MLRACEVGEVFALLEGGSGGAHEAAEALYALYSAVREPYVTRGLLHYHARTGSARALELLARAPDTHARHLLDALQDQLRADRPARHHALSVLAPLVALRPPWLHRLTSHPVARDLVRAARHERDPLPLVHALLALAALTPAAPALAAAHPLELADALLRPALLDPPPPAHARPHLLFAQRALFRTLYATHPCTLADALRSLGAEISPAARDQWERTLATLADSVRLHPALLTGSRTREADPARWARLELHDVVAETRRLTLTSRDEPAPSPTPSTATAAPCPGPRSPAPGSGAHAARSASALRPGAEPWFPLAERCGADSAPATPLPADEDAAEPPEAAVEATPENTPARETRAQFRFPGESSAVRAIGRKSRGGSPPSAPPGEMHSARLARVQLERRAADSPVSFAGAPPPAVPRPEPNRPVPADEPLNVEDREVLELTRQAPALDDWPEREMERSLAPVPSRPQAPARLPRPRSSGSAPRRSSSCGRAGGSRRCEVAVQTVDVWPEPYEFLIADLYRASPEEAHSQLSVPHAPSENGAPSERLEEYLTELYAGQAGADSGEHVALLHAQLMYERWRRDVHAERNRRLLGRCRQVRTLELRNQALGDRVRALTRERDELRARGPPATARNVDPTPVAAAATELAVERAARLRAEAALHEAQAARALDAADLQRQRADSFETARHVEALARAALAAERRAEYVRRLRRELLVLSEREARLAAAVRAPPQVRPPLDERAMRAACARAEADAEAATARADAATARAHDLETALAAREAALTELKRSSRAAAEESAARLRALRDKYSALVRVVRATEARRLEWLAEPVPAAPAHAAADRDAAVRS